MDQVPEIILVYSVAHIQPVVREATSEEENLRRERFKRYYPPNFSGLC